MECKSLEVEEQLELDYQRGGDINKKIYPPSLSVQHLVGQIEKEGNASDSKIQTPRRSSVFRAPSVPLCPTFSWADRGGGGVAT